MKIQHLPRVGARYWTAITLASLFGTNLGDLYAHDSGLGLLGGLPILAALAAAIFLAESKDIGPCEFYYWLVIIVIRTGATNIADFGKKKLAWSAFALILLVAFAALAAASVRAGGGALRRRTMPSTGAAYWLAMLAAGVFGTFYGDMASKVAGKGGASLLLGLALAATLAAWRRWGGDRLAFYWIAVATARTAGTAMGDWLAENKALAIGLPLSTAITGAAFVLVLALWPRPPAADSGRGDGA